MHLIHKVGLFPLISTLTLGAVLIFIALAYFSHPSSDVPIAVSPSPSNHTIYLPYVENRPNPLPLVNVPFFSGTVPMNQMAIFWFGRVTPNENYVDVRVGYNADSLVIHVAIIDRRLWCSSNPSSSSLALSDSVDLYLDTSSQPAYTLSPKSYRFAGQLGTPDCPESWTASQGSSSGWNDVPFAITASTGWRGDLPNNDIDDRGWSVDFRIPFRSLGLSAAPDPGTVWKLGVEVHDRNDSAGRVLSQKEWPDGFRNQQPPTWASLSFGLPVYHPAPAVQTGVVVIRNKRNGILVPDAQVGGGTVCGDGLNFWTQWGEARYPGSEDNDKFNIQNQGDIADWPCFSKYYVTFPLNSIPAGKVILSAQLRLHQFGNAGGSENNPPRSWIQVFTVRKDWSDTNLTWNNAPQMSENVSQAWVDPLKSFPGWPGVLQTWDVSRAVSMAYNAGTPLRLALYTADEGYHSGKYFVSSDTGDWNAEARPELQIVIGSP